MAKRKAARATGRKKTAVKRARRTAAPRLRKKASAKPARRRASAGPAGRKASPKKRPRAVTRTAASRAKAAAAARNRVSAAAGRKRVSAAGGRKQTSPAAARQAPVRKVVARKAPALDRERRVIRDDDIVPSPPSSLDLDRSASAARSGRRGMSERLHNHTETSPAITGGDIDADWESAYAVGDEAPGGDNPTPDQDIVDDIGKALGVQYEDNEELKGEKKISDRDKKRWELDPASAEDYNDHEED
jgi:hypothetical protein